MRSLFRPDAAVAHDELPILLDAARNVTDLLAVPEIDIGTCRSDDRRTRVLRKQQTAKFGLGLFAFDRELSVYPDRRSINMMDQRITLSVLPF